MPHKLTPLDEVAKRYTELIADLPAASAAVLAGMIFTDAFLADAGKDAAAQYVQLMSKRAADLRPELLRGYIAKRRTGEAVEEIEAVAAALAEISKNFGFNPKEPRDGHGRWVAGASSTFDAAHAVGSNDAYARHLAGLHARPGEESSSTAYRRLRSGAQLLTAVGGSALPPHAALALRGASYVGQYGPEAQKVFGPPIERAKYRYRGTERALDPALAAAVREDRRSITAADAAKNKKLTADVEQARAALATERERPARLTADLKHEIGRIRATRDQRLAGKDQDGNDVGKPTAAQARGITTEAQRAAARTEAHYKRLRAAGESRIAAARRQLDAAKKRARTGSGIDQPARDAARDRMIYPAAGANGDQFSATLDYFRRQLPAKQLSMLQRLSGHLPPSEGVIINAKGEIGGQMVGSGDDWYLPFNLANLGQLQAGEYVRTRGNGGLTTEDIYTGLMAGARAMTVVSRNGVYTMEFDDQLRGSRRYSAAAREMTERYGQLLDAVKAGQVRPDIPQDRVNEIYEQAEAEGLDPKALIEREIGNPSPSRLRQQDWSRDYLDQVAARTATADGAAHGVTDLIEQRLLPEKVAYEQATYRQTGLTPPPVAELREQERAKLNHQLVSDPIGLAVDVDAAGFARFMKARSIEYANEAKPMRLDGPGYGHAMEALREQFPYFIKRVKYTPWHDAATTGSKADLDHGYVKPRFVRPAGAKAGYFDESVTGEGKRGADTTHYQNFGVMRGRGHYQREERREPSRTAPSAPQASDPAAPGTGPTPAQDQAAKALLKHFIGRDRFGPKAEISGPQVTAATSLAHQSLQGHRDNGWMQANPQLGLSWLHLSPEQIDAMTPEQTQQVLRVAEEANKRYRLFERDEEQNALEDRMEELLHTEPGPAGPPAPPRRPAPPPGNGGPSALTHRSLMLKPVTIRQAAAWGSGQ